MLKKLAIIVLLFNFSLFCRAQYTDLINSNYPGFSISPYSVGNGVYQFESNIFHSRSKANTLFDITGATGINLDFRTSFFIEKLEFNLNTSFQKDEKVFNNIFKSEFGSKLGLSQFTFGAKYLIYAPKYNDKSKEIRSWNKRHGFDFRRCIPHIGFYAGANIGNIVMDDYNKGITPKLGILLQNEFDLRFNLITNVYYDHIGSEASEWSYIVTGTYLLNERWSGYLEHQAKFDRYANTSNVGAGLTYLQSRNLQFNSSIRAKFEENSLGYYTSIGLSYRINRHVDKFIALDEYGNRIDEGTGKKKRGFFGRIWKNIIDLIYPTEEVEIEEKDETGRTVKKTIKLEKKERKKQKSVLDGIIKRDRKTKRRINKAKDKAKKKQQRKEEKKRRNKEEKIRDAEDRKLAELENLLKEKEGLLNDFQKEKEKLEKEEAEKKTNDEQPKEEKENTDTGGIQKVEEEAFTLERVNKEIDLLTKEIENQKKTIADEKAKHEARREEFEKQEELLRENGGKTKEESSDNNNEEENKNSEENSNEPDEKGVHIVTDPSDNNNKKENSNKPDEGVRIVTDPSDNNNKEKNSNKPDEGVRIVTDPSDNNNKEENSNEPDEKGVRIVTDSSDNNNKEENSNKPDEGVRIVTDPSDNNNKEENSKKPDEGVRIVTDPSDNNNKEENSKKPDEGVRIVTDPSDNNNKEENSNKPDEGVRIVTDPSDNNNKEESSNKPDEGVRIVTDPSDNKDKENPEID